MKKKTIIFYIATLTRGGAERVIANLANYFVTQDYEVYMATLEPEEGLYPLDEKINKIVLTLPECHSLGGRIKNLFERIFQVRRLMKQTNADALVAFIGKTNIRAILAGLGLRTKVFVSVRSAPAREYAGKKQQLMAKLLFRLADGIVFQSEGARDFFSKSVQKKSTILFNPLSPEYVGRIPLEKRNNRIITVGRMDEVKNHALLVQAFARVVEIHPEMELTIYGGGDCMEEIQQLVKTLGIEKHVMLPGDSRDIPDKIKDARVFVLSSNFEGMPNAVAEAMALGIPVVSTDCPSGGARMLVADGETGLLVPIKDAEKMAAAIMNILDNPELEAKLRKNCFAFSQKLYPDKVNAQWKQYIEEICKL